MSNQNEIAELLEDLHECFMNYQNSPTPALEQQVVNHAKSLAGFLPIANETNSLFVLNAGSFFSHHSIYDKSYLHPLIFPHQHVHTAPWVALTHPDDLLFILRMIKFAFMFLDWLPCKRAKEFCFAYPHRIKNNAGQYDSYIISFKVAINDATGKPYVLLMQSEKYDILVKEDDSHYRFISMEPAKLFNKFRKMNTRDYAILTRREKEIVGMVNYGLTCKQIAEKDNVSEGTISKHYSNINKKVGFGFIKLACMYAAQLGLF